MDVKVRSATFLRSSMLGMTADWALSILRVARQRMRLWMAPLSGGGPLAPFAFQN